MISKMCGRFSCEMALASRSKRCLRSGLSARCSGSTLIATVRSRQLCRIAQFEGHWNPDLRMSAMGSNPNAIHSSANRVNVETSFTNMRLPETVGCVHVELSATS